MKKSYLILAAIASVALASCSNEEFVGENTPTGGSPSETQAIIFSSSTKAMTRADIMGPAAADLLGKNFYVMGTKGTEATTSPTPNVVFDNYLVHYGVNTAGTTESNTANWEYVGIIPGTTTGCENYVKLSSLNTQTIKYWDYEANQYDFLAFSTGTFKAVNGTSGGDDQIGVTAMAHGTSLASSGVAYTFDIPSVNALKSTYITDITEVVRDNYGKEVQLKFKNLGSKVRIALYETVPGYSVKNVVFYKVDGTTNFTDGDADDTNDEDFKSSTAALISANTNGLPTKGTIAVYFPHVGDNNASEEDYDKAAATVTPVTASSSKTQGFGALTAQLVGKDPAGYEDNTNPIYLGRSLPNATFAGDKNASFYQTVFPVSNPDPLTLRVDYTLVSTDGSGEEIHVYGAKAVVPSNYTKWLPNYAYTYIFKISDNTNGWTKQVVGTTPAGLFPITFDAVVTEATDAQGEQTTITTVATPSITTYQQGHNPKADGSFGVADEYDNDGEKLYVQVMDNTNTPAMLVGTSTSQLPLLNAAQESATPKYHASLLYKVNDADATEAEVMDALEKRASAIGNYDTEVKGRNGITLTYNPNINNAVTNIVNGVDDNAIEVSAGQAAEIAINSLTAGTYAYVYDYSWNSTSGAWTTSTTYTPKHEVQVYQPITTSTSNPIGANGKYYIAASSLATWDAGKTTQPTHYTSSENAAEGYLYFSITTNGGATTTYSFVSVDGKIGEALPDGLLKVPADQLTAVADNTANAAADTFYFDTYFSNNGKYAVKVIKVVD